MDGSRRIMHRLGHRYLSVRVSCSGTVESHCAAVEEQHHSPHAHTSNRQQATSSKPTVMLPAA